MPTPIDVRALRQRSLLEARRLGYAVDAGAPPLMAPDARVRPLDAIVDRMMVLETLVGCATGLPLPDASLWLEDLDLESALTPQERTLLAREDILDHLDLPGWVYERAEALQALAWATSLVPALDFAVPAGPELLFAFDGIDDRQAIDALRRRCRLRPTEELLSACDLLRCLHHAISQKGNADPGKVKPPMIVERRRGLEWLLGAEAWDSLRMKV